MNWLREKLPVFSRCTLIWPQIFFFSAHLTTDFFNCLKEAYFENLLSELQIIVPSVNEKL